MYYIYACTIENGIEKSMYKGQTLSYHTAIETAKTLATMGNMVNVIHKGKIIIHYEPKERNEK